MAAAPSGRPAGFALIAVSLLAVLAMSHHPTVSSTTVEQALAEIGHERRLNSAVHGTMIVIVGVYFWGFSILASILGGARVSVGLGRTALAFATITMAGAAIVSGFVVPEFAERLLARDALPADARTSLVLLHASNQALAWLGTLGYGLTLLLLGIALVRVTAAAAKWLGVLGIACGSGIIIAISLGHLSLNVGGMTAIVVALGLWASAAGGWLAFYARHREVIESG